MVAEATASPFQLRACPDKPLPTRLAMGVAAAALERVMTFPKLDRIYRLAQRGQTPESFVDRSLRALGVRVTCADEEFAHVPAEGPTVVVANHPFGGVEGMILARLLCTRRPDVKIMANRLLSRIEPLRDLFVFVDPFGGDDATRASVPGIRAALRHLREGGLLVIFPSGTVSHLDLKRQCITDPAWHDIAARLIRKSKASAVPVFFEGHNRALFQLAGLMHPRLRTVMLPSELTHRREEPINLRIGQATPFDKLPDVENDADLTHYLRLRTYMLGESHAGKRHARPLARRRLKPADTSLSQDNPNHAPIADALPADLLQRDIDALPTNSLLVESGDLSVYIAPSRRLPNVLPQIGREREITFRLVDEGTGKPRDLDRFDRHYRHLFIWHREAQEIVGAYRVGQTDLILRKFGKRGLYTSTLFKLRTALLRQVSPALELGRSFVTPSYQKSYAPLMLLWKGIGQYLVRHPRYRYLFGPASINDGYRDLSQWMIKAFLEEHCAASGLAGMVKPKNPPRLRPPRDIDLSATSRVVGDINDVSNLITQIEADHKGVPILVKQYLKMNAKLLAFNVDPEFGNTLDGLMLCDLMETDPRTLGHYLTREGVKSFRAYHERRAVQVEKK